jgi:hypothetical protein
LGTNCGVACCRIALRHSSGSFRLERVHDYVLDYKDLS